MIAIADWVLSSREVILDGRRTGDPQRFKHEMGLMEEFPGSRRDRVQRRHVIAVGATNISFSRCLHATVGEGTRGAGFFLALLALCKLHGLEATAWRAGRVLHVRPDGEIAACPCCFLGLEHKLRSAPSSASSSSRFPPHLLPTNRNPAP